MSAPKHVPPATRTLQPASVRRPWPKPGRARPLTGCLRISMLSITEPPDPPASYKVFRRGEQFLWTTAMPALPTVTLPIEVIMGGRRHGLGFLSRIEEIGGIPLERPALIQNRYAWSFTREALVLAPGCAAARPRSFETAFGLVLSPTFEARCLSCHGQPNVAGTRKFRRSAL